VLLASLFMKACRVNGKTTSSAFAGGAALSSLVLFIPLTHVGCCSMWLYILSLIVGAAFVSTLLEAPLFIMTIGITVIWINNTILYLKYKKTVKQ